VSPRPRSPRALLATLAVLGGLFLNTAIAAAEGQPQPLDLQVSGGESNWHADNDFRLDWDLPAATVTAVDFRVRDAEGREVIPETHLPGPVTTIDHIYIPVVGHCCMVDPGRYTADVWLEGPNGEKGAPESAMLLFDPARPASIQPSAPSGWISGDTPVIVRIGHPPAPLPISGIHGYAVSVDSGTEQPPCAGLDRCAEGEIDLPGGVGDDILSLRPLREGTYAISAVAVSGSGMRSAQAGSAIVRVDATKPEVALRGVPQDWARGPVRVTATATDALSGMAPNGPNGPFTALAVDGGVPSIEAGDSVSALVSGSGAHRIAFYARDAAGNIADGSGSEQPPTAMVRIDEAPPAVAFVRSEDPADPERIEANVTDRLSGADPGRGSIAVRPAGSRQRFEPIPTTAAGGRLTARWDSDSFPAGDYEFKATGYDAAGNSGDGDRRSNGARMVLANPLKTVTTLEAGFGGRRMVWQHCSRAGGARRCRRQVTTSFGARPGTRSIPYGHRVQFGGRLTAIAGTPLGGLPVQVVERFDGGVPAPRTTAVETAADGSFSLRLAPGPSRHVEAQFAGNRVLTRAGAGAVQLGVLAGVWLHASKTTARIGGAPVAFSGRVAGVGDLSGSRLVELQFHLPGAPWSEFRTVQTGAYGHFHYAYTFSDDDSRGVRFQFRARIPEQGSWPYEPGISRPVAITGR
jgi:hypothetical protein